MDFLDLKTIFTTLHIIGTSLGVGGATVSDIQFFRTIKDGRIDKSEFNLLQAVSLVIWLGLGLLIVSGIGLVWVGDGLVGGIPFWLNQKFMIKQLVVLVALANGIYMHHWVFPLFSAMRNKNLASPAFVHQAPLVFTSGAVSLISWYSALILGSLRSLPFHFLQIGAVYVIVLIIAMTVGYHLGRDFCKKR